MSSCNQGPATFPVSAALKDRRVVILNGSDKLAYAGATSVDAIGVTCLETFAADESVAVEGLQFQGFQTIEAAGAISARARVFLAANGKVAATGTICIGIARKAVSEDGDWVEVIPVLRAVNYS